jgi:hypothetical protein
MESQSPGKFEEAAQAQGEGNLFVEMWLFLRDNKKWWLLPILVVLLGFGLLILLSGSGAAPFIYTLF